MKRYALVLICVLFVILASALRHLILPHAKSAALRHSRVACIAEPVSAEESAALMNFSI